MPKTVRFCINCGREIGEALSCSNPECGGIPNFYRNVPGPDHAERAAAERHLHRPPEPRAVAGESAMADTAPFQEMVEPEPPRRTMAIANQPVAVLRSTAPPPVEHLIALGGVDVGARSPAGLVIDRPEISSRHARIECTKKDGGGYKVSVVDNGSTNGTYLNGKRIKLATLTPGDKVRFATVEFEFQMIAEERPRVTIGM